MDIHPSYLEIALRLLLATFFGGMLGLEREWKRKPAGLRTHILVALGSCCFLLVGLEFYAALMRADADITSADPLRLVEGIVGGLGFLGAGAILTRNGAIEGLTTAGGLWLTGAIGLACGGGHYWIACIATALGLVTLHVLARLERRMHDQREDPEG